MTPVRVVVCDDAIEILHLMELELEAHREVEIVGTADNGEHAIRVVRDTQPDVVLLDLSMPIMDGLEALPHIRRAAPDARVVVVSGFDSDHMAKQALEQGAVGYIEKGLDGVRLVAAVLDASRREPPPLA